MIRHRWLAVAAALIGATLIAGEGRALSVGDRASGMIDIAAKQVPLPEGEWRVAAIIDGPSGAATAPPVRSAALVRLERQRVTGLVVVHANAAPALLGYGASRDCKREDMHFAATLYSSQIDLMCAFVAHVVAGEGADSSLAAAVSTRLRRERWQAPDTWLMAGFRISNRRDLLDVRYHFPADTAGAPTTWESSTWSPEAVKHVPARQARVLELVRWAGATRSSIELGFRGRLAGLAALPMPGPEAAAAVPAATRIKLDQLEALRQAGVLTGQGYAAQKAMIEAEAKNEAEGLPLDDMLALTASKTFTYKIMARIDGLVVTTFFAGSIVQLAGLNTAQGIAHLFTFTVHDFLWNLAGVVRKSDQPPLDFPGFGLGGKSPPSSPQGFDRLAARR